MIIIGCDHGGYKLKQEIKRYLEEKEITYKDLGCMSEESVDYPNIAKEVAKEVQKQKDNKGILICRSGIGMSIVANKFKGLDVLHAIQKKWQSLLSYTTIAIY